MNNVRHFHTGRFSLVLCLASCSFLEVWAQTSASTPPVGYVKVELHGLTDNAIALPVLKRAVEAVSVASVPEASRIRFRDVVWNARSFERIAGLQPVRYRAEFATGPLKGVSYEISTNDADSLTLVTGLEDLRIHDLGAPQAGNLVLIRPDWKVDEAFGSSETELILTPFATTPAEGEQDAGDSLRFFNGDGVSLFNSPQAILYYVAGAGWNEHGSANIHASDYPFQAGVPFIVRTDNEEDAELVVLGDMATRRRAVKVPGGDGLSGSEVLVGLIHAEPMGLEASGLYDSLGLHNIIRPSQSLDARDDEVWFFNRQALGFERSPERLIAYVIGQGWQEVGPEPSEATTFELTPEDAFVLRLRPDSSGSYWITTPEY